MSLGRAGVGVGVVVGNEVERLKPEGRPERGAGEREILPQPCIHELFKRRKALSLSIYLCIILINI